MERGFYKVYLESNGFKTPVVTYAKSRHDAAERALEFNRDDLPLARVHEIQGPYSTMFALESC